MDVFELLSQHHRDIDRLLDQVKKIDGGGDNRQEFFAQFRKELELHTRIEEEGFYLELQKYPKTKSMVADALQEHDEMKLLVERTVGSPVEAKEWSEIINEIRLVFHEHLHGEESQLFPAARKELDPRAIDDLGERMQEMKQRASA